MNFFQAGTFKLASGKYSDFKLECDALSDSDISAMVGYLVNKLPAFEEVHGIPTGGLRIANQFSKYAEKDYHEVKPLIVDDVWTTGGSVRKFLKENNLKEDEVICAVLFARGPTPDWVYPFFTMDTEIYKNVR